VDVDSLAAARGGSGSVAMSGFSVMPVRCKAALRVLRTVVVSLWGRHGRMNSSDSDHV